MNRLGTMLIAGLFLSGAAACKKKKDGDEGGKVTEGTGATKGTGTEEGTGKASGTDTAPPKTLTPEEKVAWYQQCWSHFNDKNHAEFKSCFADDVVSKDLANGTETKTADEAVGRAKMFHDAFPDMKGTPTVILYNDEGGKTRIAGVWHMSGTHTGTLKTPMGDIEKTDKKVGIYLVHGVEVDANNKAKEQWEMFDMTSFMGQLGLLPDPNIPFRAAAEPPTAAPEIVIAKNDEAEKKNLEADKAAVEAFNARNVDGMLAMYAEDAVWSDQAWPKDQNKQEMGAGLKMFMDAFSDLKLNPIGAWPAGDYVLAAGQMTGTNDKAVKEMMLDGKGNKFESTYIELTRFKDGKIAQQWLFSNSMSMMMQLHPEMAKAMAGGGDQPAAPAPAPAPADDKKPE